MPSIKLLAHPAFLGSIVFAAVACGSSVAVDSSASSSASSSHASTSSPSTSPSTTTTVGVTTNQSTGDVQPTGGLGGGMGSGMGGFGTDVGTGFGGSPPTPELCVVASKCVSADVTQCTSEYYPQLNGDCGAQLAQIEACFESNALEMEQCEVSASCEFQLGAYNQCVEKLSTGAGEGEGAVGSSSTGGCSGEACTIDPASCSCSEDCNGQEVGFICTNVPGGALCSCSPTSPGSAACFDVGGCNSFDGNCCFKN